MELFETVVLILVDTEREVGGTRLTSKTLLGGKTSQSWGGLSRLGDLARRLEWGLRAG